VRAKGEKAVEHRARRGHHLCEQVLHEVADRQPLEELVTAEGEVDGVGVDGVDGIHERMRLHPRPVARRRARDRMARGVDVV